MDKVEEFINNLSSPDYRTRINAAYDLGELRDDRAVEPLIQVLKDSDANTRHAAAEALGKMGGVRAKEALSEALKDSDSAVVRVADRAVGATAGLIASSSRRFINFTVDTIIVGLLIRIIIPPGQSGLWGVLIYFQSVQKSHTSSQTTGEFALVRAASQWASNSVR